MSEQDVFRVALYSSDRTVRAAVRRALGSRVAKDLPELDFEEFATPKALMRAMDAESFDLGIFDGESVPLGGMGLSMQVSDEIPYAPPIVVLVARQADAWLAAWSRAAAISPFPVDPVDLPKIVEKVLRADAEGGKMPLSSSAPEIIGGSSRHEGRPSDLPEGIVQN